MYKKSDYKFGAEYKPLLERRRWSSVGLVMERTINQNMYSGMASIEESASAQPGLVTFSLTAI